MKPEIMAKILGFEVLKPSDPIFIADADDSSLIVVKHGLVRFGTKCAFLGCPMFDGNMAYSEAVMVVVTDVMGNETEIVFDGPGGLAKLISDLSVAEQKLEGWDTRYLLIQNCDSVSDAAREETLEESRVEAPVYPEDPRERAKVKIKTLLTPEERLALFGDIGTAWIDG